MDLRLLEQLLCECECSFLDFKAGQYPFAKAADFQKDELLKDLLAFSNQSVRPVAYIIVGAKESTGQHAMIQGVSAQLDEHSVQQFVHSKTNKPIHFKYTVVPCDGKSLGVFEILSQPLAFLKNDFGRLRRNVCYIRQGSATVELSPEDAFRLGEEHATAERLPVLELQLARIKSEYIIYSPERSECLGPEAEIATLCLRMPESEYPMIRDRMVRNDYYQEFGEFLKFAHLFFPLGLTIQNSSPVAAADVRCTLSTPVSDNVQLFSQQEYPACPLWPGEFMANNIWHRPRDGDISVQRESDRCKLEWLIPKILPMERVFTKGFFLVFENCPEYEFFLENENYGRECRCPCRENAPSAWQADSPRSVRRQFPRHSGEVQGQKGLFKVLRRFTRRHRPRWAQTLHSGIGLDRLRRRKQVSCNQLTANGDPFLTVDLQQCHRGSTDRCSTGQFRSIPTEMFLPLMHPGIEQPFERLRDGIEAGQVRAFMGVAVGAGPGQIFQVGRPTMF